MPRLPALGRPVVFLLGVLAVVAIGVVDWATGVVVRVYPLYFVPVSFVCWKVGRKAGIAFAVLSAISWEVANALAGMDQAGIAVLTWNTGVQLLAFLVVALLMAELRERLECEKALSRTDPLTGLANGAALRERAELEVERARRWRRPLTLAYLDLDDFKSVNDTRGHAAGDELLRVAAAALSSVLRSTDLAARVGGDEFVLLLPETDEEGARTVLESARDRLGEQMRRGGWPVTASVGSITTDDPRDAEDLLRVADARMYDAKRAAKAGTRPAGTAYPA
jgi:diguanylate cyclase (GGDEF)-like protein